MLVLHAQRNPSKAGSQRQGSIEKKDGKDLKHRPSKKHLCNIAMIQHAGAMFPIRQLGRMYDREYHTYASRSKHRQIEWSPAKLPTG